MRHLNPQPQLSYFISKANSIKNITFQKKIRIAILSSFTINGLEESLIVKCAEHKIQCETYNSPYKQYNQDILSPASPLYEFSPDLTFMIIDTRTILSSLFYNPYSVSTSERREYIDNRVKELANLVRNFTGKSDSKLVVANFSTPVYTPYGICETKAEYGLREMILDLNSKLSTLLQNEQSTFIFNFDSFVTKYGEINVFDYRQFLVGDIKVSLSYIPYLAEGIMDYVKAHQGINRKCIVLDLDNTLWGGIVGEDGYEGIKLSPQPPGTSFVEFQRIIQALYARGIILAINSRNNEDEALRVIREHPYMVLREDNFASIKINWNDKISNMKAIAEELNIGLDSLVYFDDDPVNREVMSKAVPEVMTVDLPEDPALYAQALMNLNDFNTFSITEEDKKRGQMYFEQRKRIQLENSVSNLEDFLSQLSIKIIIKTADEFTIPRIGQLVLKTNQFNLTTNRFREEEIRKFTQNKNMWVGCAQTEDKFGDNGITGVFIVDKNSAYSEWTIDTFLLSCRVMGRGIEDGIMQHILNEARKEGVRRVKGRYIPTKKNKPCENFLSKSGFKKEEEYWVYSFDSPFKMVKHLELIAG
ncbi:MAG: HAD-IIIC family phosphatase [Nitrososphaeraceae archaeon]